MLRSMDRSEDKMAATGLAIFASGRGSNAQNIIDYFRDSDSVRINLIVTNNAEAGVIEIARTEKIPLKLLKKGELKSEQFREHLKSENVDFIVLAGFLKHVPIELISAYEERMINIHPALLPKFGGKGMYGRHVHEAVHHSGELNTGITVHFVNAHYDEGKSYFSGIDGHSFKRHGGNDCGKSTSIGVPVLPSYH